MVAVVSLTGLGGWQQPRSELISGQTSELQTEPALAELCTAYAVLPSNRQPLPAGRLAASAWHLEQSWELLLMQTSEKRATHTPFPPARARYFSVVDFTTLARLSTRSRSNCLRFVSKIN